LPQLPVADIVVLVAYILGVVGLGCYFVRKSRDTEHFMAAGRSLPGWAVGLSIFGTYLSSNTFIGYPGIAYGGTWNRFVFSLSLPLAAWIAVKWFVPFYRKSGEISAYHHLERRFGPWARSYALACYLLMQVARMGAVMFGVAIALDALTGWGMAPIIIAMGALVTLYTLLGGIEAVIWTDVAQSIVLVVGAVVVAVMLLVGMPGGPRTVLDTGLHFGKFSLGSFGPSLSESTFWVVLLYGIFANLKNFGIDQSFVQRYRAARDEAAAGRSVWMAALLYIPISLLFLFIGTCLFAYYQHPSNTRLIAEIKRDVAAERLAGERDELDADAYARKLDETAAGLGSKDIGAPLLHRPQAAAGLGWSALRRHLRRGHEQHRHEPEQLGDGHPLGFLQALPAPAGGRAGVNACPARRYTCVGRGRHGGRARDDRAEEPARRVVEALGHLHRRHPWPVPARLCGPACRLDRGAGGGRGWGGAHRLDDLLPGRRHVAVAMAAARGPGGQAPLPLPPLPHLRLRLDRHRARRVPRQRGDRAATGVILLLPLALRAFGR